MFLCLLFCSFIAASKSHNILFILLDDVDDMPQTKQLGLPKLSDYFRDHGTNFENAFVTTPICCPSRASILTGTYQHNHRTLDNTVKNGCDGPNWDKNVAPNSVGKRLQDMGYRTGMFGKYSNNYKGTHVPEGWDYWLGLNGNSVYYNYNLTRNGVMEEHKSDPTKDYLPYILFDTATNFINNKSDSKPWFAYLSFPTAHEPFDASPENQKLFEGKLPPNEKLSTYNQTGCKTKHWYTRSRPPLTENTQLYNRLGYRRRLQSLLTVDAGFMKLLKIIDPNNTSIIFTSDNGFYFGEWGMILDKRQPYEIVIRVPFMASGPFFEAGLSTTQTALNIDVVPTILDIANRSLGHVNKQTYSLNLDGTSLIKKEKGLRTTFLIEYHGMGNAKDTDECSRANMRCWYKDNKVWQTAPKFSIPDGKKICFCVDSRNNTFTCLRRIVGSDTVGANTFTFRDFLYCRFDETQFHEMYNLQEDPLQITNIWDSLPQDTKSKINSAMDRISKCSGFQQCNILSDLDFEDLGTMNF